jgi:hypothetical protein
MGFLSDEEQSFLKEPIPWKEATQKMLGTASSDEADLLNAISSKPSVNGRADKERLISGLKWRKFSTVIDWQIALLTRLLQLVFFLTPRSHQMATPWTRSVRYLRRRWLSRRESVILWYVLVL